MIHALDAAKSEMNEGRTLEKLGAANDCGGRQQDVPYRL
ncbi:hypothetical protein SUS17_62 [Sphingomonas sp. S17]|nr:hypothetical protein SUS17_62 [Sphingomonas sp. S17]